MEIQHQWQVKSRTDPDKIYTVTLYASGLWRCECPHNIYRQAECHHIKRAKGNFYDGTDVNIKLTIQENKDIDHVTKQGSLILIPQHTNRHSLYTIIKDLLYIGFSYGEIKRYFGRELNGTTKQTIIDYIDQGGRAFPDPEFKAPTTIKRTMNGSTETWEIQRLV